MSYYYIVYKIGKNTTGCMRLKAIDSGSALNKGWCELASYPQNFKIIAVIEEKTAKQAIQALRSFKEFKNHNKQLKKQKQ